MIGEITKIARVITSQSNDPVWVTQEKGRLVRLTNDPLLGRAPTPNETVVATRWLPRVCADEVDYETELAVVIGWNCGRYRRSGGVWLHARPLYL